MTSKKKDCPHEDDYGICALDGIHCFLCGGVLRLEQSGILMNGIIIQNLKRSFDKWKEDKSYSRGDILMEIHSILMGKTKI